MKRAIPALCVALLVLAIASCDTYRLLVIPAPDQPVAAANDSYTVSENSTLIVASSGILENDQILDGGGSAALISSTVNGVLALEADGSFVYTPTAGFVGADSFVYEVSDVDGDTAQAVVTIHVTKDGTEPSILLQDDFSGNLTDTWNLYGNPNPIKETTLGNPSPCFDNNGDGMYDSGATSRLTFDFSNGLIIEGDMYCLSSESGCWVSATMGILQGYDFHDTKSPSFAIQFTNSYSGTRCDSQAEGVASCHIITESGELEGRRVDHYNDLQGEWHHYKIVIEPSRHVKFYIDGDLFYATTGKVSLDYNNMPVLLGNRSSYYGDALHDNVKVSTYIQ